MVESGTKCCGILFFLHALNRPKKHLSAKIEREKLILQQLPELSVRVIDFAHDHGRVSARDMLRLTSVSRNTLKQQLSRLVDRGYSRATAAAARLGTPYGRRRRLTL